MAGACHADLLQRLVVNLLEQIRVNVVGCERLGILAEADPLQPSSHFAHAVSCSSSALACFKSSVSKPSVNQP
jgi:hypothetical protein